MFYKPSNKRLLIEGTSVNLTSICKDKGEFHSDSWIFPVIMVLKGRYESEGSI